MPESRNPSDIESDDLQRETNRPAQGAGATGAIDREQIERRAYERYQARGAEPGRDQEDWFEAEREAQERE